MRGRGQAGVTARGLALPSRYDNPHPPCAVERSAPPCSRNDVSGRRRNAGAAAELSGIPRSRSSGSAIAPVGLLRSRSSAFCTVLPSMLRITHHIERPAPESTRRTTVFPGRTKARPKQTESSATLGAKPCSPRPRPYRTERCARSRRAWSPCRRRDRPRAVDPE